jgi:hypothetical protein
VTTQVNSFTVAVGSGAQANLPQPVNFPQGRKCNRIRARFTAVMANSSTAYSMTAANLITLMSALISNWYMSWGNTEEMAVDTTLPFNVMRLFYGMMEGHDFLVNNIPLSQVSGAAVAIAGTPALTTLTFEFVRTFTITKNLEELHTANPGATQMQQIRLGITPSSSAAPTFNTAAVTLSNASAVPVEILFESIPSDADQWANVPIIRTTTTPGQNIPLPVGNGGSIIAAADLSAPASSYTLGLFDLDTGSAALGGTIGSAIQGMATFQQVLSGYDEDYRSSDFDWSTLAAPLLWIPTANDLAHLESVEQLNFYQPGNDITAPELAVAFIPAMTLGNAQSAANNITAKLGTVHLTNAAGAGGYTGTTGVGTTPSHVAAILPLQIQTPQQSAYNIVPHLVAAPNANVQPQVPAATLSAAYSAANAQPGGQGSPAGTAQLAKSSKAIAGAIPGYAGPGKGAVTQGHLQIAAAITSHGSASTAKGTAAANRLAQSPLGAK